MKTKLNWPKNSFNTFILSCLSILLCIGLMSTQLPLNSNTIIARIGNKLMPNDNTQRGFLVIKKKDVGTPYPCGDMMGISIEDNRHIFCRVSAMNATLMPDSITIDIPGDGVGGNKTEVVEHYTDAFQRINTLKIGQYQNVNQLSWGITSKQAQELYPNNTFNIALKNEAQTAFDPNNLFYEMIIGIQQLSKENAELKFRLEQLEKNNGSSNSNNENTKNNFVKTLNNPSNHNTFAFEYEIDHTIQKAQLYIFDLNGKTIQSFNLNERGTGINDRSVNLTSGTYFYQLIIDGQRMEAQKLIIQ